MKVREFVEKYNKNQRIDIAKELEVKQYIGIENKKLIAELVLNGCTHVENGKVYINSLDKYLLFVIAVLTAYTSLEFADAEDGSAIEDYDMLCEAGVLTKIIDIFKSDYSACQEVLNMMTMDILQKNETFEEKVVGMLYELGDALNNALSDIVEKVDFSNLNIPVDKLGTIMSLIGNKQ